MKLRAIFCTAFLLLAAVLPAGASTLRAVADDRFQPVLDALAPDFLAQTGVSVDWTFAAPDALLPLLVDADSPAPDLFLSASPDVLHEAVSRGIADPALRRHVLVLPPAAPGADPDYASAVALAATANRLPVMLLLDFLVSPPARDAFSAAGFTLP